MTALVNRMVLVRAAAALRITAGAEIKKLGAMVLADAEYVEPTPVGGFDFFNEIGDPAGRRSVSSEAPGIIAAKLSMPTSNQVVSVICLCRKISC